MGHRPVRAGLSAGIVFFCVSVCFINFMSTLSLCRHAAICRVPSFLGTSSARYTGRQRSSGAEFSAGLREARKPTGRQRKLRTGTAFRAHPGELGSQLPAGKEKIPDLGSQSVFCSARFGKILSGFASLNLGSFLCGPQARRPHPAP